MSLSSLAKTVIDVAEASGTGESPFIGGGVGAVAVAAAAKLVSDGLLTSIFNGKEETN